MSPSDKLKVELDNLREKAELKQTGKEEVVSTGSLMLDMALHKGCKSDRPIGIPRGCVVDLFGDEGLGKTTLTLYMMAERIRNKEHCVYLDVEHRINPDLLDIMIPDKNYFTIFQPKDGDAALSLLESVVKMKDVRMLAVDSMAAIVPSEMFEEDAGNYVGLAARKITNTIKKILPSVYENRTIVVLINQMRANLSFTFRGSDKKSTSHWALKFLASIRLQMTSDGVIRVSDDVLGQKVVVTAVKNSFAAPYGKAPMSIIFGKGIDRVRDLIDCGILSGVIEKNGGWFAYRDEGKKGEVAEIKAHGEEELVQKLTPILPKVMARIQKALQSVKEDQGGAAEKPAE